MVTVIGPWTDFYSLGATIYNLLTDSRPPGENDIIYDGEKAFGFNNISLEMSSLILRLMSPRYDQRPQTIDEVEHIVAQFYHDSVKETSSYTYRQSEPEKDPKVNSDAGNPFKSMSDLEIELKIIKGEYITFLENNVLIADGQPASFLTNDKSEIYELREKIIMLSKALGKNDLSWCDNLMKEILEKNSSKTKARQKKGFINRLFGRSLWK